MKIIYMCDHCGESFNTFEETEDHEQCCDDKKTVYCLVEYMDDSYSYSGVSEYERYYFTTQKKAEDYAKLLGLIVVNVTTNSDTQATLEIIKVL